MKRVYFLVFLLASCFASSNLLATNGANMIGFGAESRAMGGVGIAVPVGPDSGLKNPALLDRGKNFEMIFGATYFSPKVSVENKMVGKSRDSAADTFVMPEIGLSYKVNEKMTFGLGAYGVAGLAADYRGDTTNDGTARMSSSLSLMKFAPSLAYKVDEQIKLGVSLQAMYGVMSMSYDMAGTGSNGAGASDSLGFGYSLGAAYQEDNLTLGFSYQSPINMEYKRQLKDNGKAFRLQDVITSDNLEQPAEVGIGLAYQINERILASVDYKLIQWSQSDGYKDLGWDDQKVVALGASYVMNEKTTLRLGYNKANSPLGDDALQNPHNSPKGLGSLNFLNAVGMPAIIETHYTLGASHEFTENFGLDFSFVYAPKATVTSEGMGYPMPGPAQGQQMEVDIEHSQQSATLAARWSF